MFPMTASDKSVLDRDRGRRRPGLAPPVTECAEKAGVSRSYFTRIFRLSFLAPEITSAILKVRQPAGFSAIKLMGAGPFAVQWTDRCGEFGLESQDRVGSIE
jgi:hypothetical protein